MADISISRQLISGISCIFPNMAVNRTILAAVDANRYDLPIGESTIVGIMEMFESQNTYFFLFPILWYTGTAKRRDLYAS